ncbi:MAG: xanthine dehydrogenase family protein molybdopterin-binding subunit [Phycisphaerales bacterium]|nr:xanthine dehydrogenase family protein molybdopterin-binding subunit [Phycisphaerales bacterium]
MTPQSTKTDAPRTPEVTIPPADHLVGKNCKRVDGREKVTGLAMYGADLFPQAADLFAKVVRSEEAHADIVKIDTSAALAVGGVLGVYTHADVGGTNIHGLIRRDHPALAEKRVRYRGDAIAVVVAESERSAEAARDRVHVEYSPLPVVATMEEALSDGAPRLYPEGNIMGDKRIRRGDVDAALAAAHCVVTDTFHTQTVDHAFLDVEAGTGIWDGHTLTLNAPGQWVHEERRLIALALGIPVEQVRIIQPVTGGAFGGREDISIQIYLGLAALKHPGKTIGLRYDRAESMRARHKRHALKIEYTLAADREGTLTAARITVHSDEGAYASTGIAVMRKAASHATGPYRVPAIEVDVYGVHTNNNPTGAMRGFGACQMAIAYEGMMDRLADALEMDRVALRKRNMIVPGDPVTTGQRIDNASVHECLDAALAKFNERPYPGNDGLPPHLRRGWGMSAICFGLGYGDGFPDCSRARVEINPDGGATVYTGGVEVGQGLLNTMMQIAGEELGLPFEKMHVVAADTELTDESGSSSATRQTYFTGNAVRIAASELREQILDVAGKWLNVHPHEVTLQQGWAFETANDANRVSMARLYDEGLARGYSFKATGLFKPRTVPEVHGTGQSPRAFITYLFGAHVSQVLVDIETGEVKVERHIAAHDVGKAINPQSVEGQIVGGVAQGLGMALMEEVVYKKGRILNAGFTDYIIPTIKDLPPVEAIIIEHDDPGGPFGAHGVGEPPLIGAVPAILSAIYDATGVAPDTLPVTPERMWRLLRMRDGVPVPV